MINAKKITKVKKKLVFLLKEHTKYKKRYKIVASKASQEIKTLKET